MLIACRKQPRKEGRTEWVRPSQAASDFLATLRVPAGVANDAALLAGQAAAAVGAGTDDRQFAGIRQAALDQVVLGHGPGNTIRDGEDGTGPDARRMAVLYASELVDHLGRVGAVGEGHRDHTPQGVRERGGRPAGLAEDDEALPRPELVVVHRDVHGAVAGPDLLGHASERAWPAVARLGERGEGLPLALRGRRRDGRRRRCFGRGRRHGRLLPAGLARGQSLRVARAVPVDRYALATRGEGLAVGVLHVFDARLVGQVDGLGDTHRRVLLERRLHPDVPLARDVVRSDPYAAHVVGDILDVTHGAVLGDLLHQPLGIETPLFSELDELGVYVGHLHIGLTPHERHGEERLDAARATGDHGDRTRRGDGGDGRVPDTVASSLVARALEVGHDTALVGEGPALLPGLVVHELHHPLGEGEALVGVVGYAELDQEVGEAHDPEPDAPVAPAHPVDLVQRVVVLLDHVVQEAYGGMYRLPQLVPVDLTRLLYIEALQVDRTQIARVIRRQMRLATRIRALDLELRRRVVGVDLVYKHDARLAVEPRPLHYSAEEIPRPHGLDDFAVTRVPELEVRIGLHSLHELVRDGDGDVEVVDLVVVALAVDELLDIGVVHPEDAHVGPPPGAALLDLVRRSIINRHERNRPARHTHRGLDQVVLGTQAREPEARAPTALVNNGLVLEGVVDAVYGVLDRQHEARAELLQLPACVHEGRRVGHELPGEHHLEEPLLRLLVEPLGLLALLEAELTLGNVRRDPPEHLDGLLDRLALLVFLEVALFENGERVICEFYICKPVAVYFHAHPPYFTACFFYSITKFARVTPERRPRYLPAAAHPRAGEAHELGAELVHVRILPVHGGEPQVRHHVQPPEPHQHHVPETPRGHLVPTPLTQLGLDLIDDRLHLLVRNLLLGTRLRQTGP